MSRERASIDFPDLSGFEPKSKKPLVDTNEVKAAAENAGFQTRHAPAKAEPTKVTNVTITSGFDARSLRKSNRTAKLNIATTPANRERFWTLAQASGLLTGEDALSAMMDAFENHLSKR